MAPSRPPAAVTTRRRPASGPTSGPGRVARTPKAWVRDAAAPAGANSTTAGRGPRRPRLTRRAVVVALVVAVLLVSYASSLRAYLQQRAHLSDLRSRIETSQAAVDRLTKANARWKDDGYVKNQARSRLGWVMPGETAYQALGADGQLLDSADRLPDASQVAQETPTPWWATQYSSLQKADHPPAKKKPPVQQITPRTEGAQN